MSIYASFDGATPCDLASNQGWSMFGEWVGDLDHKTNDQLFHLYGYGWCQDLAGLETQLREALDKSPPEDDKVATTANALLDLLGYDGDEVLTITNGMSTAPAAPKKKTAEPAKGE